MIFRRKPKGTPTGGQFEESAHDEATATLGGTGVMPKTNMQIAEEVADDWRSFSADQRHKDIGLALNALEMDVPNAQRFPDAQTPRLLERFVGPQGAGDHEVANKLFTREDMVAFGKEVREADARKLSFSVSASWTEPRVSADRDQRLALDAIQRGREREGVDIQRSLDERSSAETFTSDEMIEFANSFLKVHRVNRPQ